MKKKDWIYLIVLLLLLFFGFLYYSFVQSGLSFSPNEFGSAPKCPRPSTLECTSINEGSSVCTESGCRCTCRVWGGQPDWACAKCRNGCNAETNNCNSLSFGS